MPKRIQRKRAKGWTMPDGAVYVGRPTRWGNPFRVWREGSVWFVGRPHPNLRVALEYETQAQAHAAAVKMFYSFWLDNRGIFGLHEQTVRDQLRGKDLCCWCPLDMPCHADVLLEIANGGDRK